MPRCHRDNRIARGGFTLVEAIVAIIILSVAVPPMLWTLRDAQRQRINPVLASRARWLAVEKLEDIVADRHSRSGQRGYAYLTAPGSYPAESPVPGHPAFTRAVSVLETGADLVSAGTGYATVTVTVSWTGAEGEPMSLSVSTVLTEYVST